MRKSWILFLLGTFGLAAPLWAGAPPLSFSFGPVNPGAQIAAAGGVTTFLQFTVTNNSTENVDLTSFSFQASGTADDAGTNLALYLDANQDGVPDGGALASQPFSVDNGALGLSFTTQVLAPGASQTFLVQGGGWSTLGTAVRSLTGVVATGETTTLASVNSGLPLTSSVVTVVPPPALVQAPGPSNPGWNTVTAGTGVQVLVLQFTLSNTASESVNLAGIQIQGAGTGNETLLGSVRLWEDLGPDGMDGSDLPLDTENYAADNGLVTLNASLVLIPGQQMKFLVSYDPGTAVGTHIPSLGGIVASGTATGAPTVLTGTTVVSGGLLIVPAGSTATDTPSATPVQTATETPSATPVQTATKTSTATAIQTATGTAVPTATGTPVPTAVNTAVPTATDTPVPTATDTPVQTATFTAVQTATDTPVQTATFTAVQTATDTPVQTATFTAVQTATDTPVQTATFTAVQTATDTPIQTATDTPVQTATDTPVQTATDTPVQTATDTPVQTATDTPVRTATDTPVRSATNTPAATHTATRTPSPTRSPTPKPTPNLTLPGTPSPTPTVSVPAVLSRNVFRPAQGPLGISFKVLRDGPVSVKVFSLSGARVRSVFQAEASTAAGWIQAAWDGRNEQGKAVASGLYWVSIQGGGIQRLLKVDLLR